MRSNQPRGGRPIEARKRQEDVDGEMPATRARTYPASTYPQTAKNKPKPTTILEVEADQDWARSGPARPPGEVEPSATANNQRTEPERDVKCGRSRRRRRRQHGHAGQTPQWKPTLVTQRVREWREPE